MSSDIIAEEDVLRSKFGTVGPLALAKSRPALDKYSRQFIAMSPFLVISTADSSGKADLSPRGDPPGFVHMIDDKTIVIPDRPGNNRGSVVSDTGRRHHLPDQWPRCDFNRSRPVEFFFGRRPYAAQRDHRQRQGGLLPVRTRYRAVEVMGTGGTD